jgi:hypothetical protein
MAGYLDGESRLVEDEGRKHCALCKDFRPCLSHPNRQHNADGNRDEIYCSETDVV